MQREGVERNEAEQWCTYLHLRCNTGNEFGFEVGDESKAFGGAKPWEQAGIPFVLAHMEDLIAVSILMETRQGHCWLVDWRFLECPRTAKSRDQHPMHDIAHSRAVDQRIEPDDIPATNT